MEAGEERSRETNLVSGKKNNTSLQERKGKWKKM